MPSDISELVEPLQKSLREVRELDIAHDELGTANGFHQAQAAKQEACEYIQKVLELCESVGHALPLSYVSEYLTKIIRFTDQLQIKAGEINKLVEGGTNQGNYPQQRERDISEIEQSVAAHRTLLYPFESFLRLARLESQLSSEDALTNVQQSAAESLEAIESTKSDAETVLQSLRDKLSKLVTDEAAHNFSVLAGNHKTRETNWFWGFVVASVATILAIVWAVWTLEPSSDFGIVVGAFLKRALVISTPYVFMRICISKYNLERNLRIIYNHRDTVLEQYRVFEESISDDDVEAKNQFRLELAKVIFDDPETGYTKSSASSEININPVLSTIEKVAKGAS